MKYFAAFLILIGTLLAGCSKSVPHPTIEEEIAALPDVWMMPPQMNITSNNWNMLNRISSLPNEIDRVNLTRVLFSRFQHQPEWYFARQEELPSRQFSYRLDFMRVCISRLTQNKKSGPYAILSGWELAKELELRLDSFKLATKSHFATDKNKWNISDLERKRRGFESKIRDKDEMYFKYHFADDVFVSYQLLPDEHRPVFVEQIKRDFFHRPEMKFVDRTRLPEAFR